MQVESIVDVLKSYVAKELLDGQDIGLTPSTPLLDWGVVNSIEMARLVAFIKDQFGVAIPGTKVIAPHFKNLHSIAELVVAEAASARNTNASTGPVS